MVTAPAPAPQKSKLSPAERRQLESFIESTYILQSTVQDFLTICDPDKDHQTAALRAASGFTTSSAKVENREYRDIIATDSIAYEIMRDRMLQALQGPTGQAYNTIRERAMLNGFTDKDSLRPSLSYDRTKQTAWDRVNNTYEAGDHALIRKAASAQIFFFAVDTAWNEANTAMTGDATMHRITRIGTTGYAGEKLPEFRDNLTRALTDYKDVEHVHTFRVPDPHDINKILAPVREKHDAFGHKLVLQAAGMQSATIEAAFNKDEIEALRKRELMERNGDARPDNSNVRREKERMICLVADQGEMKLMTHNEAAQHPGRVLHKFPWKDLSEEYLDGYKQLPSNMLLTLQGGKLSINYVNDEECAAAKTRISAAKEAAEKARADADARRIEDAKVASAAKENVAGPVSSVTIAGKTYVKQVAAKEKTKATAAKVVKPPEDRKKDKNRSKIDTRAAAIKKKQGRRE
jgi:hypothetical protein